MADDFNFQDLSINDIAEKILFEYEAINKKIDAEKKLQDRRRLIATELYTTERTYVYSLQTVSEHFITPLSQTKKPILPAAEVKTIFANWRSIMTCHMELLDSLRERINTWGPTTLIGDVFGDSKMNSITQLCKFYINNFDRSLASLEHYRQKSSTLKKFLDQTAANNGGLELGSYLIMPVQRITRYVLLFQSLLKCTKKTHPDYENLDKAHERFRVMADFINLSKKNSEKFSEAKKLCATIKGFPTETLLGTAGIALIKSGNLQLVESDNSVKVFVVLLTNCVVIAETKRNASHFKATVPLLDAQLRVEKGPASLNGSESRSMLVLIPSRDETTVFVGEEDAVEKYKLVYENEEDMEVWSTEIQKAITEATALAKELNPLADSTDEAKEDPNIPNEKKRIIVDAFIQKEVQYVHYLKVLKEFMDTTLNCLEEPVDSKKSPVKENQNMKKLFYDFFDSVKPIIAFHINMLALLFERMSQLQEKAYCVGDIFEKNLELAAPKYDLYSLLWEEIRSTFLIAKAEMSKSLPIKFWANVARFESDSGTKMELFLEQISQRIPFMANVLSDIFKNTHSDSPDYATLEGVYKKTKKLSDKILTLKEIAHQQEKQRQELEQLDTSSKVKSVPRISLKKALTLGNEKNKKNKS